jgi:hypothetical protein
MKKLIFLFLIPLCFSASADDGAYEALDKLDIKQKEQVTDALIGLGTATTLGVTSLTLQREGVKLNINQFAKEFVQKPLELKITKENILIKKQNGLSTKSAQRYMTVLNDKNYTKKEKNSVIKNARFAKSSFVLAAAALAYTGTKMIGAISTRNKMEEIIKCNPFMLENTHENDEITEDLADLMVPVSMIE